MKNKSIKILLDNFEKMIMLYPASKLRKQTKLIKELFPLSLVK